MAKKEKPPAPPEGAEGGEGADGEAGAGKKRLAGKQLILFIVLPAILLLGGGGAAAYFLVFAKKPPAAEAGHDAKDGHAEKDKKKDKKDKKEAKKDKGGEKKDGEGALKMAEGPNGEAFLTLPDILVNVSTADQQRPAYLKLKLTLQVADAETADAISPALPRIMDQYTGFLREMRMEDVSGSAGYARLQLELLKRVNLAVAPAVVEAVLVEEMLVQ
jgi:flagellar protein FliL